MIVQGAEEAKNPARDVPVAVMVATGTCTALYMGAAATIVGLVRYTDISSEAPFASAFAAIPSLQWAVYVGEERERQRERDRAPGSFFPR